MNAIFALFILGLCSQASGIAVGTKTWLDLALSNGKECDVCQMTASGLKASVRDQAQIREFIDSTICPMLGSMAYECKKNADDYSELVFNMMVAMDPAAACETLGMCKSVRWVEVVSSVKIPAGNVMVMSQEKLEGGPLCSFCNLAVEEVERLLKKKDSVDVIVKALEKMCKRLPFAMSGICKKFVDTSVPVIINLLAKKESPDKICHQVRACT